MQPFAFARQPILDTSLQLYAFEFLYRPANDVTHNEHSITHEVLASSILDLGLNQASNNTLAFINMSYDDLMAAHVEALPSEKIILELLEDIQPDSALITRVSTLKKQGFKFALDDFVYSSDWDPLIELSDIIKFDLTMTTLEENQALIKKLSNKNILFLAEKIETYDEYETYKGIGCTLFQGFFFSKPETIKGSSLNANTVVKTKLLSSIHQDDISFERLEEIIQEDPNLTFLLLKYLNSAHFSFSNPIHSIKQAIVILGVNDFKKWVTLLTLRNISSKPDELLRLALVRARQAELFAKGANLTNSNSYFLSGVLSVFDAMLDTPLESIIKSMSLDPEISQALLTHEGEMGHTLEEIIQYEATGEYCSESLPNNYPAACQWADQILESLNG